MLSGGANRWTNWVKEFALMNNLSYGCALSTPECKNEYREKYGTRKKLTKKQEKEQMGAEEPTGAINKQLLLKAETKKKEHKGRVTEMKAKLNKNLAKKEIIEKGKELQERSQMGAEDINQAKKKKIVKKEVRKETKIKVNKVPDVIAQLEKWLSTPTIKIIDNANVIPTDGIIYELPNVNKQQKKDIEKL